MKISLWMLIVFCLLIGSAGNTLAVESTPVKEEKASAVKTASLMKQQRNI